MKRLCKHPPGDLVIVDGLPRCYTCMKERVHKAFTPKAVRAQSRREKRAT